MESLLEQIVVVPILDWIATAAALVYVFLAGRDNNWCWLFAAVSSLIYAHQMFVVYNLVFDGALQIFYLLMAVVGFYRWQTRRRFRIDTRVDTESLDSIAMDGAGGGVTDIRRMRVGQHALIIIVGIALGLVLGYVTPFFAARAELPVLDAITTVLSVLATFLLIGRWLENWVYWMVIDAAYVYIYLRTGAGLYALLMLVYIGMAVVGYVRWKNLLAVAVDGRHQ